MGVLHIIDRVVAGFGLGEVEVKIEGRIRAAHDEEEARRFLANLFDQLVERDVFAAALAHLDDLTAAIETHELHEDDGDVVARIAQRRHRALRRATWPWWSAPQMLIRRL